MAIPRQNHIKEIHDITVEESVGEVAEDSAREECRAEAGGGVEETSAPRHDGEDDERDRGQADEEGVVVLEHSKRRAGVVNLHQIEEAGDDLDGHMRGDGGKDQKFRDLVEDVERKRQEQEESHEQFPSLWSLCPLWSIIPRPLRSDRRASGA